MKKKVLPRVFFDVEIAGSPAGRIVIQLFSDTCTKTAENFRCLCTGERGIGDVTGKPLHYKGVIFHRVVRDFMIQAGDFSEGNGRGGESIYGGYFADEAFEKKHDTPFLLSMANRGKDTNGSQFFITTQPTPHLDGVHVVFGKVVDGESIVKKIEAQPTDANSRPRNECKIVHCGELVLAKTKKVKAKKDFAKDSEDDDSDKSSKESSSDSEEESKKKKKKKKKKKHKKEKKKHKHKEEKEEESSEEAGKEEADASRSNSFIKAEEVPPVPEQKFLMRSDERRDGNKTDSTTTPASNRSQGRQVKTRSGRKVKGRGVMRYRTPSRSRSRSPHRGSYRSRRGSETPPHWREAQRGQRPLREVAGGTGTSPESGKWRQNSRSPAEENGERNNRSRDSKNPHSENNTAKGEGEKENRNLDKDRDVKRRSLDQDRNRRFDGREKRGAESGRHHHDRDRDSDCRHDRSPRRLDAGEKRQRDRERSREHSKDEGRHRKKDSENVQERGKENSSGSDMRKLKSSHVMDSTEESRRGNTQGRGKFSRGTEQDSEEDDEVATSFAQKDEKTSSDKADGEGKKSTVLPSYESDSSASSQGEPSANSDVEKGKNLDAAKQKSSKVNKEDISEIKSYKEVVVMEEQEVEEMDYAGVRIEGETTEKDTTEESNLTTEESKEDGASAQPDTSGSIAIDQAEKVEQKDKSSSKDDKKDADPKHRSRSSSRRRRCSRSRSRKRSRSRSHGLRRHSRSHSPRRYSSSRRRYRRSRSRSRGHSRRSPRRSRSRDRGPRGYQSRRRSRSRSPRYKSSRTERRSRSRGSRSRSRRDSRRSRSRSSDRKRQRSAVRKSRSKSLDRNRKDSQRDSSSRRRRSKSSSSRSSDSSSNSD